MASPVGTADAGASLCRRYGTKTANSPGYPALTCWAILCRPLYVQFSASHERSQRCDNGWPFLPPRGNTTRVRRVKIPTSFSRPALLFHRLLPSWQIGATAEVARRSVPSLRLDLFRQFDPSDLGLRLCCILRPDRSSQGYPRSKP